MGREQMLLDRIASGGRAVDGRPESSTVEDVEALVASVRRNLVRLLNARHGFSQALPDYGLPALTDLTVGSADYVAVIQEAVRTAIEKYEPRLRRVRVSRVVDEEAKQKLSFRIDAVLIGRSGEHRVCYETELAGSGQFSVLE